MNSTPLFHALTTAEALYSDHAEEELRKNNGKRKRRKPRSKRHIRQEQEELEKKTKLEIDILVADYHAKLPRSKSEAIGAIYARYSSRFQDSIVDQVRELLERALAEGIFVPRENIFYDLAVRGWKDSRPGLNRLRQAIDEKRFKTLLMFSTSRLYRRNYKAMQFVEENLVERGIRVIFVSSNLDTDDGQNWRVMLQIFGTMDEAQVRMLAAVVRSAHEGLLRNCMVCMTIPFGCTGEDIEGELTKLKRPRQRMIIDFETAVWAIRIFRWYLVDGMSIDAIVRELNDDPDAPAPVKSTRQIWTHKSVRDVLMNEIYRGQLIYGKNKNEWSTQKDYVKRVPRDEPLFSEYFPHLQLIPDECWYEVQRLLANEVSNSGRKSLDGEHRKRPRMLRGLFECPEHGRQMVAGGEQGRALLCPLCRAFKPEKRPIYTHLNRKLALQLTCEALASLFQNKPDLVSQVLESSAKLVEANQESKPDEIARLRGLVAKLDSKIDFNRREPGETLDEQRTTSRLLRELRQERSEAMSKLASHESALRREVRVPTEGEVVDLLSELKELLLGAGVAENDQELRLARRLIEELIARKIMLYQQGERKQAFGWLQGRVQVDVVGVLVKRLTGVSVSDGLRSSFEVVIDYKKSRLFDEQVETAKRLWDEGMLHVEIAEQMGCHPSYVTKMIHYWFNQRDLPVPNCKKRRKRLEKKQRKMPRYKAIANQVNELMDAGHSNLSIAKQLETTDATIAKSIVWWHQMRNLPAPTAADRRKQKLARAKSMFDDGRLLSDIAKELGYSPRGLTLALEKYFEELGETMPDGRARRGNASAGESANGTSSKPDELGSDGAQAA